MEGIDPAEKSEPLRAALGWSEQPKSSSCSERPLTRDAAAMAPVRMPRPARPIAGLGMPEVPRSRRLEGQFHRCRRLEVAPPLPRQEVHLPRGHRPRALPQAASRLGLLHQAHAP